MPNGQFEELDGNLPAPVRQRESSPRPRKRPEHARTNRIHGFNGKHRRRNKRYSF